MNNRASQNFVSKWLAWGFALAFTVALTVSAQAYNVYDAVRLGYIKIVSAYPSASYSEATLTIQTLTAGGVDVDFSTVWFVQNNDTQRIGLSYEETSKWYYLHLVGNHTYTLKFVSRCLDLTRHAPASGTYFSGYYVIDPNRFSAIINALRNQSSQSAVWNITDSGSLSPAWKAADPRPPVGSQVTTQGGIHVYAPGSWQISGTSVNIAVAKVANTSSSGISGTLRLRLWATTAKYAGGNISGYVLGTHTLGQYQAGYSYSNISGYVSYTRPPSGYLYTTITVEEYVNGSYVIRDYLTFSGTTHF